MKFLYDIKFGKPVHENPVLYFSTALNDERKIYQYLMEHNYPEGDTRFSTLASGQLDMIGLDKLLEYRGGSQNRYVSQFAYALAYSVSDAVSKAGGHSQESAPNTPARRAAAWFIDHYPLLGGIAAHFKMIEDYQFCNKNEISIAAIRSPMRNYILIRQSGIRRKSGDSCWRTNLFMQGWYTRSVHGEGITIYGMLPVTL